MTIENLDIEQPESLIAYLRQVGLIEAAETPRLSYLSGGVSNRTALVERPGGEAWVIKQALAKLRVPTDWFSSPERVHREAMGLRWLSELAPPDTIPGFVFEDHDHHLLVMQAVPQPHHNWKSMLLAGNLKYQHVDQFGHLLATIHRRAYKRRQETAPAFEDRSFFESLRLEPYYSFTASQVPAAAVFLLELIEDTRTQRLTLVHGDYSPKNILVYRKKLILLDHEVIHFGDPAFDLGFSTTHLLSKAHHLPDRRADFAEAVRRYWYIYRQTVGNLPWIAELEPRAVRHTLACMLARVAGRSPLEYMDSETRTRQHEVVVELMSKAPLSMNDLIKQFIAGL